MGGTASAGRFGRAPAAVSVAPPSRRRSLVVDLGRDLGSPVWWRGLVTCLLLCAVHVSLAPPIARLPAPVPAAMTATEWESARALSFAPLAYGADTGTRMAPTARAVPLTEAPERANVALVAVLGRGEGFARVLMRSGVSSSDALTAESLLSRHADLRGVRPGTVVDILLGRRPGPGAPRPLEALSLRARLDLQLRLARSGGAFSVIPQAIAVDSTPIRIQARIGPSLYRSARAAGVPASAIPEFLRTLAAHDALDGLSANDRFDLVLSNRRAQSGESEAGELLYVGLDRAAGRDLQLLRWIKDGRADFYEAAGMGRTAAAMQWPTAGRITSFFGWRRHPILGFSRLHKGMDFGAPHGAPVYAATNGRVTYAGWSGGYGNQVRIDHGGGIATSYSHLSRFAAGAGGIVRAGQVIGYVGSTGLSTGPHLHYELYRNGVAVDPRSVRFVTRATLDGAELAVFRAKLSSLLSLPANGG